eukprot:8531817-Pyramimonas_sp.AAC.1
MKIMGWPSSIYPPARCSAGSTEAGPSMTFVTGIHFAASRGAMAAKLSAPTGARAPRRPPTLREGAPIGASL